MHCNEQRIVNDLMVYLSDDHLYGTIYEPIQIAADSFSYPQRKIHSKKELINISGFFVQHIFRDAGLFSQILTEHSAQILAVKLLNTKFEHEGIRGIESAQLVLQCHTLNGIYIVLEKLKGIIISDLTFDYQNYILTTTLPSHDSELQLKITEFIFQHYSDVLPPEVIQKPPALFSSKVPSLIFAILRCQSEVKRMLRS